MEEAAIVKFSNLVNEKGQETGEKIASLIINRPDAANAFNAEVLDAITSILEGIRQDPSVRILLFQSFGKHFSAGADLLWMKESAQLSEEQNREDAKKLIAMFEALYHLPIPTIAVVKGASYGGAVGIVACCDYAVAVESARFCLSEVRVGLIPAVILPYLSRKIRSADLRRLTLTGRVFSSEEAKNLGLLVDTVESGAAMDEWLKREVNHLLLASPQAQRAYKGLQDKIDHNSGAQGDYTAETIAKIRTSESGQRGLRSFFDKSEPDWVALVKNDQMLMEL
ncbi:MAG: enoyl-CoA hydratase-related protein [Oligoflexus sp.]